MKGLKIQTWMKRQIAIVVDEVVVVDAVGVEAEKEEEVNY